MVSFPVPLILTTADIYFTYFLHGLPFVAFLSSIALATEEAKKGLHGFFCHPPRRIAAGEISPEADREDLFIATESTEDTEILPQKKLVFFRWLEIYCHRLEK
jgi:hypothetical protein